METLDSAVSATFIGSMIISLIIIIKKWFFSSFSIQSDLKVLLIRYFICHEAIMFGRRMQMPYRFQMYSEYGLSNSQVSEIIGYNFICTALWNLLMPIALRKLGHANLLSLVAMSYALSSIIQSVGNYTCFAISACLFGMSQPTFMMCMQDWWMTAEFKLPNEYNAHFIFNEYRLLLSLISTLVVSPISTYIVDTFGTSAVFTLTPAIYIATIVLFKLLMVGENNENENQENQNKNTVSGDLSDLYSLLCNSKETILLPIFIDMSFAVATYLFSQRSNAFLFTEKHKPKMGYVSGSYGVIELIGAQFISYLTMLSSKDNKERVCNSFPKMISLLTLFTSVLMIGIYFFFQDKITIYTLLCIHSFVESGIVTNLTLMRKRYYPGKIRNYIMTIVKLPTSLLSFFIYWYWKSQDIELFSLLGGCAMLFCFVLSFALIFINKREKREEEKKLSEEEELDLIKIEVSDNEEEDSSKESNSKSNI